jgi:hypothetical protein
MSLCTCSITPNEVYIAITYRCYSIGTDAMPESNTLNANDVTADLFQLCPFLTIQQMLIWYKWKRFQHFECDFNDSITDF